MKKKKQKKKTSMEFCIFKSENPSRRQETVNMKCQTRLLELWPSARLTQMINPQLHFEAIRSLGEGTHHDARVVYQDVHLPLLWNEDQIQKRGTVDECM